MLHRKLCSLERKGALFFLASIILAYTGTWCDLNQWYLNVKISSKLIITQLRFRQVYCTFHHSIVEGKQSCTEELKGISVYK